MTAKEVTCNRMNVCVHRYLQNTASLCVYMHFYLFVVYLHWLISCSFWFVKKSRTFHSSLHFQVFLYANWSKEFTKILKIYNIPTFEVSTLRESFPFFQHTYFVINIKLTRYIHLWKMCIYSFCSVLYFPILDQLPTDSQN